MSQSNAAIIVKRFYTNSCLLASFLPSFVESLEILCPLFLLEEQPPLKFLAGGKPEMVLIGVNAVRRRLAYSGRMALHNQEDKASIDGKAQ